jgi:hypothetical protein
VVVLKRKSSCCRVLITDIGKRWCLHGGARLKVCIVGQLVRKNNGGQKAKGQQDGRKIGRYLLPIGYLSYLCC